MWAEDYEEAEKLTEIADSISGKLEPVEGEEVPLFRPYRVRREKRRGND